MMRREQILLGALSAIAWADGKLLAAEAALFREVVDALSLGAVDRAAALAAVLSPPAIAALPLSALSAEDRRWLLSFGYLMIHADGTVLDEELAALRAVADALGVPWAEALDLFDQAGALLGGGAAAVGAAR